MERKKLNPRWIKIREHNREIRIDPADICYCKAERSYSRVFLKSGKSFLRCKPLKSLEKQLPREYFFRCHRSYLANMLEVEFVDIEKWSIIQKLYQIPFSRGKTAELLSEWSVRIISKR